MSEDKNKKTEDAGSSLSEIQFAENFMAAAEKIYAGENPGSDRSQCFTKKSINKIVGSGELPNEHIEKHLFNCSECFIEYREVLKNKTAATPKAWAQIFKLPAIRFAAVCAAVCIIFAFIILSFWRFGLNQSDDLAKGEKSINSNTTFENAGVGVKKSEHLLSNEIPEIINNTKEENSGLQSSTSKSKELIPGTNSTRTEVIKPSSKGKPGSPSSNIRKTDKQTINLILDENRELRNNVNNSENKSGRSPVILPAQRLNLSVKLPGEYPAGQYSIRITDAFGNVLLERQTVVKNGTLTLKKFDLRNLNKAANKLCLKRSNEIPDCFDVKIIR